MAQNEYVCKTLWKAPGADTLPGRDAKTHYSQLDKKGLPPGRPAGFDQRIIR
ncbi:hypothetical protein BEI_1105 [Halomonas beimenensis]|uniref:Uncharacterized protein n=1 Tax=Halomonas beimenensis TaxID=475662 RepID=A0A291P5E8_9GAMM|nr:hypothetical protein BEI_1105 [Halomonas beimenensis]